MKKAIMGFMVLITGGILFFTSCKKNTDLPANTVNELKQASATSPQKATTNATQTSSLTEEPTGTAEISEDLYNASLNGSLLAGMRTGDHTYVGLRPFEGNPTDPCAQDWLDFYAWYNANYPALQAWANANCRQTGFCWSGKCIVCILGIVRPNSERCRGVEVAHYQSTQKVFEAGVIAP